MRIRLTFVMLSFIVFAALSAFDSAPTHASGPVTGYPHGLASLGDSITRAYDADPSMFGEQPENSWSTGTNPSVNSIYSRLLAVDPAISGNRFNDAVSGARMSSLNGQAQNAVAQGADLVLIFMGGNDVCTSTEASMTPVATFQSQFEQAMQTLATGLPDARIGLISVPDVYNLWAILKDNSSARSVWSFANICQSLLANPLSTDPADVQRRANVRQRNMDFNDALNSVCAEYVHCRWDNYLAFNTGFTASDVSTIDYFHPSLSGQTNIASLAWANSFDFTDTTPPVSDSVGTPSPGGDSVQLTASDAAGVSGIEYKLGAGAYAKYTAPPTLTTGTMLTWRAVDLNGNSEASHACRVGGWSWSNGDSDCDGFPDSVSAGHAAESFMGTDPTGQCAATAAANDEPTPDAWPFDNNDDQKANLSDILHYSPVFNTTGPGLPYVARFDLNGDGHINLSDVLQYSPVFNKACA